LKRFKPESYELGGRDRYKPYPRDQPSNTLFVKNLRLDVDEQKVVDMVKPFMPMKVVVFHFKGRALIEFPDENSCLNAMNYLNNSTGLGEAGAKLR
jgi:RNA recognition motif-containing protein